jgi:HEAT repeat protein
LAIGGFCAFGLLGVVCLGQQPPDSILERARDILLQAVAVKNPDTRLQAVYAVSLVGARERVISRLATMLEQDSDVPVRLAIVSCLGDFNNSTVIPILTKALKDPAPEVGFAAAQHSIVQGNLSARRCYCRFYLVMRKPHQAS